MKDIRDNGFEEKFRKAFEEAEQTPDQAVWAKIDAHLANQEAEKYKRRLFYFKLRAAAAAILVFGFLGMWLLNDSAPKNPEPVAATQPNEAIRKPGNPQPEPAIRTTPDNPSAEQNETETNSGEKPAGSPVADASRRAPATVSGERQESKQKEKESKQQATVRTNPARQPAARKPAQPQTTPQPATDPVTWNEKTGLPERKNPEEHHITRHATKQVSPEDTGLAVHPVERNPVHPAAKNALTKSGNAEANPVNAFRRSVSAFDRLSQPVAISAEPRALARNLAPPQVNAPAWEDKTDYKDATASRWSVGVNFTPSQFNPNISVANDAATQLAGGNPFASNSNDFVTATGITQDDNLLNQQQTLRTNNLGDELENTRTLGFSYNVGVDVGYALSEKFSLQSGVQYLYNNSQVTTDNYLEEFTSREKYPAFVSLIADEPVINEDVALNSVGTGRVISSYSAGVTEVAVYNTYQYLSIPVRLHYKIAGNKLNTSVGAGLAADIFLRNTIGNSDANVNTVNFDGGQSSVYRAVGLSGLLSARLNYQVASRYSFFLEPGYRLSLTPFTRSSLVKSRPDSFGIGTGVQYRF